MNEENQKRLRKVGRKLWAVLKEMEIVERDNVLQREMAQVSADWVQSFWMARMSGVKFVKETAALIPTVEIEETDEDERKGVTA